jgi:hypothetical protein
MFRGTIEMGGPRYLDEQRQEAEEWLMGSTRFDIRHVLNYCEESRVYLKGYLTRHPHHVT